MGNATRKQAPEPPAPKIRLRPTKQEIVDEMKKTVVELNRAIAEIEAEIAADAN